MDKMGFWTNELIDRIESSIGACVTCGARDELGNSLCVKCWDYVIDNQSATNQLWPSPRQYYLVIKAKS